MTTPFEISPNFEQDRRDVFVSYAHSDGAAARDLNGWLNEHGHRAFFERSAISPGLRWVPALEDAIGRSKAVAICVFEHGISNTQLQVRAAKIAVQPTL